MRRISSLYAQLVTTMCTRPSNMVFGHQLTEQTKLLTNSFESVSGLESLFILFLRLLISVVNSSQFCGVAEMISEVSQNQIYNYWWEDLKWSGVLKVNWIYIKDVHFADVNHVLSDNTPVCQHKDGS